MLRLVIARVQEHNTRMLRLGIAILAAGLAAGQVLYTRVSDRPEIRHDGITSAIWDGHALIGVEKNRTSAPIVWTLDGSSRKDETRFPIPDAAAVNISSFAGAPDGRIALAGFTMSDGKGFIGIIPFGRGDNVIIRPEGYRPAVITIAADGVIWTIGIQKDLEVPNKTWFNVLKRFSPSGKLLSSEALKVFGAPNDPIDAATGSVLRSSRDRVGWLTSKSQYLEFDLIGMGTNRFPGPAMGKDYPGVVNVALGDDFEVVVGASNQRKIWTLDRVKGVWNPARFEGEPLGYGMVYGFEGDQLVMGGMSKDRGFLLVRFSVELESK